MNKNLIITAVIGALTIILGAFGAHALEESLNVNELKSFETGVRYQMFHVLALLFVNTYKGESGTNNSSLFVKFTIPIGTGGKKVNQQNNQTL